MRHAGTAQLRYQKRRGRNGSSAARFLLKDVSVADLTRAIRLVAGGETLIRPAVTERWFAA